MIASVPLKGTYLPYTNNQFKGIVKMSFRPLAGDLSSLQAVNSFCGYKKEFPSPCRGLIFLTDTMKLMCDLTEVSVPLQGTYLPYDALE